MVQLPTARVGMGVLSVGLSIRNGQDAFCAGRFEKSRRLFFYCSEELALTAVFSPQFALRVPQLFDGGLYAF